jgi:hypothetical protein
VRSTFEENRKVKAASPAHASVDTQDVTVEHLHNIHTTKTLLRSAKLPEHGYGRPRGRRNTKKQGHRPATPPITVTSNINLIKTQKELDTKLKGVFTIRNTRNGTRPTTKSMEDYTTLKTHLENTERNYYTFHTKEEKLIKAVIRHLPIDTPDIANKLLAMGYKIHNVKQMTATRQQLEGGRLTQALPLFLITLERSEKSQEIFKLTQLHHIINQVEAYRACTGLSVFQLPTVRTRLGKL